MKSVATLLLLLMSLTLTACQNDSAKRNADHAAEVMNGFLSRTIAFTHQDAASAANHARAEFAHPPMEAEVQLKCDAAVNGWVVTATARDMARVQGIAARYDQPGAALWK